MIFKKVAFFFFKWHIIDIFSVVQLLSVSDSLRPHSLQDTRLPCPSLSPAVCSNSCPLSQWCHPTISFSVTLFSSCLQDKDSSSLSQHQGLLQWVSFFPMSQLFTSGDQSIGVSALASVLLMNSQGWFPLGWLFRSCCPKDSEESPPITHSKV